MHTRRETTRTRPSCGAASTSSCGFAASSTRHRRPPSGRRRSCMPDGRPALLVVSPDVGLDTIGGERIRKLTSAFDAEGWRLVGVAPPERDFLTSLAPWPESLVVHRTRDANPWTLGVFLKRRLRGGSGG